jgi:tetratricopeptide (TPR) repeat protein
VLSQALALHQAGRLAEAEKNYLQVLKAQPHHFDSLHLLGVIYHQRGNYAEAVRQIDVALKLNPELASAYNNRGNALKELKRLDEAVASYDKAIALNPGYAEAFNNRGVALKQLRRFGEALASYDKAIALKPDHAEAFYNRGVVLQELKQLDEALASYDKAIALKPDHAKAFNNRGVTLKKLRRLDEALASYEKALALKADYAEAFSNRGNALKELKRLDEALASFDKAIALKPDCAGAFYNRGNVLQELTRLDEALVSFDKALTFKPDYADAFNNRGVALSILGRPAEAEASFRGALHLRPDFADAHNNLAYALLLTGRFEEGWTEHEWRWRAKHMSGGLRNFSAPLWNGEAIGDRVILLHAEQGLGDTLQFCRYVPLIASAARIVLEVQAPLVRLLSQLPGVMAIVARGDSLPTFDVHCPLLSLPRVIGTTLDTIPASTPYLAADPALAADWRKRLAGLDGLLVGLVWAGGRRLGFPDLVAADRRRSIALDTMEPLRDISGVSFISLQKDGPADQAANPPRGMVLHDFTANLHDFADTAALVDGLDLVISVDTSVAHLAGALGKPVWLLNRFDTCWRWLLNRDDSPWYATLRQFRQPSPGDWNSVICGVRDALQRLATGGRDQLRPRQARM